MRRAGPGGTGGGACREGWGWVWSGSGGGDQIGAGRDGEGRSRPEPGQVAGSSRKRRHPEPCRRRDGCDVRMGTAAGCSRKRRWLRSGWARCGWALVPSLPVAWPSRCSGSPSSSGVFSRFPFVPRPGQGSSPSSQRPSLRRVRTFARRLRPPSLSVIYLGTSCPLPSLRGPSAPSPARTLCNLPPPQDPLQPPPSRPSASPTTDTLCLHTPASAFSHLSIFLFISKQLVLPGKSLFGLPPWSAHTGPRLLWLMLF